LEWRLLLKLRLESIVKLAVDHFEVFSLKDNEVKAYEKSMVEKDSVVNFNNRTFMVVKACPSDINFRVLVFTLSSGYKSSECFVFSPASSCKYSFCGISMALCCLS
jgi:hypothetical protein